MKRKSSVRVLAWADTHLPFEHKDTLEFLKHIKKKYSPDVIVNLGDEIDMCAISDYDTDPGGMSAGDELKKAIEHIEPYYDLFPNVKVCTSNHTSRPFRRADKYGIPRAFIR